MKICKLLIPVLILLVINACNTPEKSQLNEEVLVSLGKKYKMEFAKSRDDFKLKLGLNPNDVNSLLGYAEANVYLYIFGYVPRNEIYPEAMFAVQKAFLLDSTNSEVQRLKGIMYFLDWDWENSQTSFQKSIKTNPANLSARHWYSLYLSAMGDMQAAMAQSDTIMTMDANGDYLVGRGSLLYFQQRFAELKTLMIKAVAKDTTVPWAYDWLGMAYNGLGEHQQSMNTYYRAFNLSDGTVEVGAGLGHALGEAGEIAVAKQMADFYTLMAKDNYLPYVQRAFIHIGIKEYPEALNLLEQAYDEKSWFLIFVQIEPWYNPIRSNKRFSTLVEKMNFPKGIDK